MLLIGKNAVYEALRSVVTVEKVLILKDAPNLNAKPIADLCREKKIPVQYVDRRVLDKLSAGENHRGFIGTATDYSYCDYEELFTKDDLMLLLLDGIEDPHNLGAIIRSAECAGADGIIIPRRRCCGVTDTVIKVSCGAASHVKIAKVNNLNDVIRDLKDRNVRVLAADMDGESVFDADLTGPLALVIGSEGNGVHSLTRKLCDGAVSLPQKGKINSLNASVAAGIMLYECVRQRG